MDFPIFHLDFLGNRLLIAGIAVLHVVINHSLAVGAMPLVTALEWWGHRRNDERWDRLAYRILTVCFVITTTVGALTGVGIWLSTSLVNPYAIGSLIRVFFWAWFVEWLVFVAEVLAIMVYYLTWKRLAHRKALHIGVGAALSALSWVTMAIITAILGFMMDPGSWLAEESFVAGVFNPIYLPQLAFRTPVAMMAAGLAALFLAFFFTRDDDELRSRAVRWMSLWSLAWLPLAAGGALWYWRAIPDWMAANVPVALGTQRFAAWYDQLLAVLAVMVAAVLLVAVAGTLFPRRMPRAALLVPFAATVVLLGSFERVREFIRKPFVIGEYMYANGLRAADYPLFKEEGILRHATYTAVREVTDDNRVAAGAEVFRLSCTRCHTATGVNAVTDRLRAMYGPGEWDRDTVTYYLLGMHTARPFMPPFPGTEREAGALADYLLDLRGDRKPVIGAQDAGVESPPPADPGAEGAGGGA
jgi:mono/diheme cytochrome c family protein